MALSSIPAATAAVLDTDGVRFAGAWYQYLWRQWLGLSPIACAPLAVPAAPSSGFVIYCDIADGKLKAKSSLGSVTVLANP